MSDSVFKILVIAALGLTVALDLMDLSNDDERAEQIDLLIAQHEDIDIDVHEIAEALEIEHHDDEEESGEYNRD